MSTLHIPRPASMEWRTPLELFKGVQEEFGLTTDAAASRDNAMLPEFWTKEQNALEKDWTGKRIWCNPPYGREQIKFIEKAAKCEADIAILLVPARTETKVWHSHVFGKAEIRFISGRLKFGGCPHNAPFSPALLIYERYNDSPGIATCDREGNLIRKIA